MSKFGRRINKVRKYLRRDFPEIHENFSIKITKFKNTNVGTWNFSCTYKNKHVFSWGFDKINTVSSESFYNHTKGNFRRRYCKVICRLNLKK